MPDITKVASRAKLKPRREPYWHRLAFSRYVGFRLMTKDSAGHWLARSLDTAEQKRLFRAFGDFGHLSDSERFDAAAKAAREWFQHLDHGGSSQTLTIRAACERYVEHLRRAKGTKAAQDVQRRFEQYVFDDRKFSAIELEKLKLAAVKAWRNRLQDRPTATGKPRTDSSLNRDMTCLRSALNLAKGEGVAVTTDAAWKKPLAPIKKAEKSGGTYLEDDELAALVKHADCDLATFLRGQCLLPVRPGAMAQLTVADLDLRLGTLHVRFDKANADRKVELPNTTAKFFAGQAANKLPGALLFTRADGRPWDKDSWKGPFRKAAEQAGLSATASLYDLRHTAITNLLKANVPVITVAKLAGTSVRMLESNYSHIGGLGAASALDHLAQRMGA